MWPHWGEECRVYERWHDARWNNALWHNECWHNGCWHNGSWHNERSLWAGAGWLPPGAAPDAPPSAVIVQTVAVEHVLIVRVRYVASSSHCWNAHSFRDVD